MGLLQFVELGLLTVFAEHNLHVLKRMSLDVFDMLFCNNLENCLLVSFPLLLLSVDIRSL